MQRILTQSDKDEIFDYLLIYPAKVKINGKLYPARISGRLLDFPHLFNDTEGFDVQITWTQALKLYEGEISFINH